MVRYAVELTRALAERSDVRVEVVCGSAASGFWSELLGSPDRVHPIPDAPTPVQAALERSGWALRQVGRPVDVVHGVKHLLPRTSSALRVLTVHDMLPLDRPWDFALPKRLLLRGPYLKSIHSADLLLCVSAATRQRLTSYAPAVARRAHVVPLAVGSSLHNVRSEPLGLLRDRQFALVVGDPSPRKNLRTVIDAWPQVRRRHPRAVLALVGPPGWGTGESDRMGEGVEVLGHVSEAQLRWCYEHATVVACPSVLEGFGLPSIEALSFGRPLLTSEDPALCEASAGHGTRVYGRRPTDWALALAQALDRSVPASSEGPEWGRSWADVAEDSVRRVREALGER